MSLYKRLNFFLGASGYLIPNQIGPYYRGFFCDDDTIRYNYKPNSIPFTILLVAGLLITFATVNSSLSKP